MNLGEHFRNVASLLARADIEPEDSMAILNNYAVGVQQALDAKECPRCQDFLVVTKDRLMSTERETWLTYRCEGCKLELSRPDVFHRPWWKRLFG